MVCNSSRRRKKADWVPRRVRREMPNSDNGKSGRWSIVGWLRRVHHGKVERVSIMVIRESEPWRKLRMRLGGVGAGR